MLCLANKPFCLMSLSRQKKKIKMKFCYAQLINEDLFFYKYQVKYLYILIPFQSCCTDTHLKS